MGCCGLLCGLLWSLMRWPAVASALGSSVLLWLAIACCGLFCWLFYGLLLWAGALCSGLLLCGLLLWATALGLNILLLLWAGWRFVLRGMSVGCCLGLVP